MRLAMLTLALSQLFACSPDTARFSSLAHWRGAFGLTDEQNESRERIPEGLAWTPLGSAVGTQEGGAEIGSLPSRTLWLAADVVHAPQSGSSQGSPGQSTKYDSLYIPKARYEVSVFADARLIYRSPPSNRQHYSGVPSRIIPFPEGASTLTLALRSDFARIGLGGQPWLGQQADMLKTIVLRDAPAIGIGAFLTLLGLGLGIAAAWLRLLGIAYLASVCFLTGVFTLGRTDLNLFVQMRAENWEYLQAAALYAIPAGFFGVIRSLFPTRPMRILRLVGWVSACYAVVGVGLASRDLVPLVETLRPFQLYLVASYLASLVVLIDLVRKRQAPAVEVFWGALVLFGSVMHDLLQEWSLLPWRFTVGASGFSVFLTQMAILVSRRALQDASMRRLYDQELDIAKLLQSAFLPAKVVDHEMFTLRILSRASFRIAGDWFSHHVERGRWLHITLGDVTGHGVGSALLASYAKGALDAFYVSGSEASSTSDLHCYLNSLLSGLQSNRATMTAVSISLDLMTGELLATNTGHPGVLVADRDKGEVTEMKERNRTIIGLQPSLKTRAPSNIQVAVGQSIVLYSDGFEDLLARSVRGLSRPRTRVALKELVSLATTELAARWGEFLDGLPEDALEDDVTVILIERKAPKIALAG